MHSFLKKTRLYKYRSILEYSNFGNSYIQQTLSNKSLMMKQISFFSKYYPKYYGDFNTKQPQEYWDYENYENSWGLILLF